MKDRNTAICVKIVEFKQNGKNTSASIFALENQPDNEFFVGHTKYFEGEVGGRYTPVLTVRPTPYMKKMNDGKEIPAVRNTVFVNWEKI